MAVCNINTILFVLTVVKTDVRYTSQTSTTNSFMHIKLEAAVLIVGVKRFRAKSRANSKKFLLRSHHRRHHHHSHIIIIILSMYS